MRYARCVDLLDDLHAGLADGTYAHRLKRWARAELLLIDDVGLGQVKRRSDEPTAAQADAAPRQAARRARRVRRVRRVDRSLTTGSLPRARGSRRRTTPPSCS